MSPAPSHAASKDVKKESATARLLGSGMYEEMDCDWDSVIDLDC